LTFRSHRSRPLSIAVAVAVAVLLAACGHSPSSTVGSPSHQAPTVAPTAAQSTSATGADTDPVPPPLDDNGPTANPDVAKPSKTAAGQARTAATAFMRAFARTDLAQQQWWDGVSGYFTPDAAAAYEGTAVANVPVHSITEGSAKLVRGSTKYRAQVTVKTDIGTYTVTLIRADDQWLVDRSTPPKGVQ
jgi:hypothetical protein